MKHRHRHRRTSTNLSVLHIDAKAEVWICVLVKVDGAPPTRKHAEAFAEVEKSHLLARTRHLKTASGKQGTRCVHVCVCMCVCACVLRETWLGAG